MSMYATQPREVSIETFALCNAACEFCPYPTLDRKGARLPTPLIDRLLREMRQFTRPFFFSPFKVNEPFLDARLMDICKTFSETTPLGRLRLFTNGSTLTHWRCEAISKLERVEHVWISLNSVNAKDYARIMQLSFEQTRSRLDVLHDMVRRDFFRHPVVISAVSDIQRPDVNFDFREYVRDRWPRFTPFIIKRDAWIDFTEASCDVVPPTPCARWEELSVTATGTVALCCMDGEAKYTIGDVNTQTLLEIYNSPQYARLRREANARATYAPCNRCTY